MTDVVVSTECPTCAASLDFPVGTNAVRCAHCRSNLLVTGRKRVLSYSIAPSVDAARAVAQVKTALAGAGAHGRVQDGRLFFVPYYRLTGQEFRWERPAAPGRPALSLGALSTERGSASRSSRISEDGLLATIQWAGPLLGEVVGKSTSVPAPVNLMMLRTPLPRVSISSFTIAIVTAASSPVTRPSSASNRSVSARRP